LLAIFYSIIFLSFILWLSFILSYFYLLFYHISIILANEHYSPPTEWIMREPNKNKMAGVNAWLERSIKSIFNGFFLKILLRSLPVYILKQLFFSISVNSGRIFTSPLRGSVISCHYSPRFQRIIVKYYTLQLLILETH